MGAWEKGNPFHNDLCIPWYLLPCFEIPGLILLYTITFHLLKLYTLKHYPGKFTSFYNEFYNKEMTKEFINNDSINLPKQIKILIFDYLKDDTKCCNSDIGHKIYEKSSIFIANTKFIESYQWCIPYIPRLFFTLLSLKMLFNAVTYLLVPIEYGYEETFSFLSMYFPWLKFFLLHWHFTMCDHILDIHDDTSDSIVNCDCSLTRCDARNINLILKGFNWFFVTLSFVFLALDGVALGFAMIVAFLVAGLYTIPLVFLLYQLGKRVPQDKLDRFFGYFDDIFEILLEGDDYDIQRYIDIDCSFFEQLFHHIIKYLIVCYVLYFLIGICIGITQLIVWTRSDHVTYWNVFYYLFAMDEFCQSPFDFTSYNTLSLCSILWWII